MPQWKLSLHITSNDKSVNHGLHFDRLMVFSHWGFRWRRKNSQNEIRANLRQRAQTTRHFSNEPLASFGGFTYYTFALSYLQQLNRFIYMRSWINNDSPVVWLSWVKQQNGKFNITLEQHAQAKIKPKVESKLETIPHTLSLTTGILPICY